MTASIIIRALNEAKWLGKALESCTQQTLPEDVKLELILVDSGSTDETIKIAKRHGCRILHISKTDFTFGRSLNVGCDGAAGDILVFISAHCIPSDPNWLANLIAPLRDGTCDYVYGGQHGLEGVTRFSEEQVFAHYFPAESDLKQAGFFCNNANAAITRKAWAPIRFDEEVTGLEDMVLAKAIVAGGGQIGYVADAGVTHIHEETYRQVRRRYFREALTMRDIMPEVQFNLFDLVRCFMAGVTHDLVEAAQERVFWKELAGIFAFRFSQYWGTYRGHNEHRTLSRSQKQGYYYPRPTKRAGRKIKPSQYTEGQLLEAETKSRS
ncbi:MAG: glycosyl transferase family 2 [Alphaproteobacteria bacterium HGW-Alphaproteobacteria-18]|nr:MAG: glycosyl transferase family 2 [Alphaproteobacteria bacterium HGW-Alphaproteobacteria-18]